MMKTNPCADRAALARRGHRTHAGNTWTRHRATHHTAVLHTQTHTHILYTEAGRVSFTKTVTVLVKLRINR